MSLEFIDIFNAVAKHSAGVPSDYIPAKSLDDPINVDTLNLDSLDVTLTYAMLNDIYAIDVALEDQWPVESVGALKAFIDANKKNDPSDQFETVRDLVREYK